MSNTQITIGKIDVMPERDLYATGKDTYTELRFDPEDKTVIVYQEMRTNSTPEAIYHKRILTTRIERVDDRELREYLESEEAQTLLLTVCAGHSIDWDGRNMIGTMTEEARDAWEELQSTINDTLSPSQWQLWDCSDWFDNNSLSDLNLSINSTDEEIEEAATRLEEEAKADYILLSDDLIKYLKDRINIAKEEAEADQE